MMKASARREGRTTDRRPLADAHAAQGADLTFGLSAAGPSGPGLPGDRPSTAGAINTHPADSDGRFASVLAEAGSIRTP